MHVGVFHLTLIAGTDMVTSHLEQYRRGSLAALGDFNRTNLVDDTQLLHQKVLNLPMVMLFSNVDSA